MKWMKRIFISIGILGLLCLSAFIVYNIAYVLGDAEGYEAGKTIGYISGKQDGYKEGEEAGYYSGKADGYTQGESVGYISGRGDGYSEGEAIGYEDGYSEGKTDGYDEGVEASLGHGYTLRDPTYKEVITFLRQDKTDKNKYIEDTYGVYVCSHFARDVGNNAEEAGLRCAYVSLRYLDGGHAIIAFNTIDKGLVYFTPQTDERVKPVVGKQYYQCIEPRPGYYYGKPSFDDTIMDILLIW